MHICLPPGKHVWECPGCGKTQTIIVPGDSMPTLSRRNLLTLLYKVQTHGYGFIQKPDGNCIRAESDKVHYQGREHGTSSDPLCEKFITEMVVYLDGGPRYRLQNRYQDSGWETLDNEAYDLCRDAVYRASQLSKDAVAYGMVRVIDSLTGEVIVEYAARHD